ncbi:MAG TPA: DMT family transporter [Deinococcales bacterium]|nr:DMT family transporter [Deinococcales bacterium]
MRAASPSPALGSPAPSRSADVRRGTLAAVLAAAIWGTVFPISKLVMTEVPPVTLVAARMLLAAATLFAWQALRGRPLALPRGAWREVFLMAVIGNAFSIVAQFKGTALAGAAVGSLVTTASPLVTVVVFALCGHEEVRGRAWAGLALAMLGVWGLSGSGGAGSPAGLWWLVAAAVSWGLLGVVGGRAARSHDPALLTAWASLLAAVALAPIAPFELRATPLGALTPGVWWGLAYLGTVSTAGAFALWVYGVAEAGAVRTTLAFFAQPLIGAALGALALGEPFGWRSLGGSLLLAAGVWLAQARSETRVSRAELRDSSTWT